LTQRIVRKIIHVDMDRAPWWRGRWKWHSYYLSRLLILNRRLQCRLVCIEQQMKGGREVRPDIAGWMSWADRPELYRMRAINRRSGYRSVYDETTKRVTEASEFIDNAFSIVMALEAKRFEVAGYVHPCCWARSSRPRRERLSEPVSSIARG